MKAYFNNIFFSAIRQQIDMSDCNCVCNQVCMLIMERLIYIYLLLVCLLV